MIDALDNALKQYLLQELQLSASELEISFEAPTQKWSAPITRPTINLYLYDMRENQQLRETSWSQDRAPDGRSTHRKRAPLRIDLSYMITCWTAAVEDQHRLIWAVLQIFSRSDVLPQATLEGPLSGLALPVTLEVVQTEGVLANLSEYWTALGGHIRPNVNLVVTLEMDIDDSAQVPLVLQRQLQVQQRAALAPAARVTQRGQLRRGQQSVSAVIRVISLEAGVLRQIGPAVRTDGRGQFALPPLVPGTHTLLVEAGGHTTNHTISVGEPAHPSGEEAAGVVVVNLENLSQ